MGHMPSSMFLCRKHTKPSVAFIQLLASRLVLKTTSFSRDSYIAPFPENQELVDTFI